mmetsp:Transcript_68893/g.205017  ORF Transcript_68893/g.205017 Transcript_68893/m.205017 type:complete len:231 (-) Transcript_68893:576-1268(-)
MCPVTVVWTSEHSEQVASPRPTGVVSDMEIPKTLGAGCSSPDSLGRSIMSASVVGGPSTSGMLAAWTWGARSLPTPGMSSPRLQPRTPMRKLGVSSPDVCALVPTPRFPTMNSSTRTWEPAAVRSVLGSSAGDERACSTASCRRLLSWEANVSERGLPTMLRPAIIMKRGSSRTTMQPSSASQTLLSHIIAMIFSISVISEASASWASKMLHRRSEVTQDIPIPATAERP